MNNILGMLGMMRKASRLCLGEDDCTDALMHGKARLLILPSDSDEKVHKNADLLLRGHSAVKVVLPFDQGALAAAVGLERCKMMAVTDLGFSQAFMKKLKEEYPGMFDTEFRLIEEKFQKTERRKVEKPGVKGKKKFSGGGKE